MPRYQAPWRDSYHLRESAAQAAAGISFIMQRDTRTHLQQTGFTAIIARPSQACHRLYALVFYGQET